MKSGGVVCPRDKSTHKEKLGVGKKGGSIDIRINIK
jgi:hypothetical protein